MSEYPINCMECGTYLGYVHASDWSDKYLCERCSRLRNDKTKLQELKNGK